MDRAEKIDCRANGEIIFTGATAKFQLKKGLTHFWFKNPIALFGYLYPVNQIISVSAYDL
jgi:hypothetical protein